jgi:hypothetical protein
MTTFTKHAEDYLQLRRSFGFKLQEHGRLLPSFAAHLDAIGAEHVSVELAVVWATEPVVRAGSRVPGMRLLIVRGWRRSTTRSAPGVYSGGAMLATEPPPGGVLAEVPLLFDHSACEYPRLRRLLPSSGDSPAAQCETPDASEPTPLVEQDQLEGDTTDRSPPDPTESRSVTTGPRSHRQR